MKRLMRPAMIGVVAVLLLAPAAASAHRSAIRAEKIAMVYQASGRYLGGAPVAEPRSAPLQCFTADITTVVKGSTWGAWGFSRYAYEFSHQIQCNAANGITIEHKIGKRWYVLWQGSEGYPPTHNTKVGSVTLRAVPRAVAKDLMAGL